MDGNLEIKEYSKTYKTKKARSIEEWKAIRNGLFEAYQGTEFVKSEICSACGENESVFRCVDCSPWLVFCKSCLNAKHSYPHLHSFEAWKGGVFIGYQAETPVWKISHVCETIYMKEMVLVDDKGRQHKRIVQFCKCETEAVRYGLWPGLSSTKYPRLAFTIELLKWFNGVMMEGHVSVKTFCDALEARCFKHHRQSLVQDLYKLLIAETFNEFRHFFYRVEYMGSISPTLDDGTSCPACYSSENPLIISFDADFQLVSKESSGQNWTEAKHTGHFFLDQEEVDSYINSCKSDKEKPRVDCSDFQAGSNIRAQYKNKKLSETALFGSACRHEYPKYFFSLRHGERLGYAVFLLRTLLQEKPQEKKLIIMYDIACKLASHLKKHPDIDGSAQLAIPIFHSYGHKVSCQTVYGPRRIPGAALTDGECLERLWSYLGKFAKITKEMTPENRQDLLVDGLLYHGRRVREKLGITLPKKLEKAEQLEQTSRENLHELLGPLEGVTDETVVGWSHNETEGCLDFETVTYTPEEKYVLALDDASNYRDAVDITKLDLEHEKKLKSFERNVVKTKKGLSVQGTLDDCTARNSLATGKEKRRLEILHQIKIYAGERNFLLELMKKYAKGQAVAIRLVKQLKTVQEKMRLQIRKYNDVGDDSETLPTNLSFDDIKEPDSLVNLMFEPSSAESVPSSLKRQAVHLRCLIDRCAEEKEMVREEMRCVLNWYLNQHQRIQDCFLEYDGGQKALLMKEGLHLESKLKQLNDVFCVHITNIQVPCLFWEIVGSSIVASENKVYTLSDEDIEWLEEEIGTGIENLYTSDEEGIDEDFMCE